jgi:hypothetical protein
MDAMDVAGWGDFSAGDEPFSIGESSVARGGFRRDDVSLAYCL